MEKTTNEKVVECENCRQSCPLKSADENASCSRRCTECRAKKGNNLNYGLEEMAYTAEYHNPNPGKIPIMALPLTDNDKYKYVEKEVDDMISCGFNLTLASISMGSDVDKNLLEDLSGKIRILFNNSYIGPYQTSADLKNHINDYISKRKVYQSFAGIYKEDEPPLWRMRCCRHDSMLNCWKLTNDALKTHTEDGMTRINLVGIEAFDSVSEFKEYLDFFGTYYKPAFWSFDCYPVMQHSPLFDLINFVKSHKGIKHGDYWQKHESFYRNMEMISATAKKYKRPFWFVMLSTSHLCHGNGYYPVQLEQHLRYQAFTALAYGAQGISYWRYLQATDNNWETYFDTPIDREGKRNALWYYVRRVNNEIKEHTNVFLDSTVIKVCHTEVGRLMELSKGILELPSDQEAYYSISNSPDPKKVYDENWGLTNLEPDSIPAFSEITTQENNDLGVVVSYLSKPKVVTTIKTEKSNTTGMHDNCSSTPEQAAASGGIIARPILKDHYIVIVSHDAVKYQNITIKLKGTLKLKELTPLKSGQEVSSETIDCAKTPTIQRHLPPGGYIIFHWEE